MAKLLGIAWRAAKRAPMQVEDQASVGVDTGVAADFRGRPGARQVTVMAVEDWRQACADAGADLPWHARRANLVVEGLKLANTRGRKLRIGEQVALEITGELDPCGRMDEAHGGLRRALTPDWRGGVTCRVLVGGPIAAGDPVALEDISD